MSHDEPEAAPPASASPDGPGTSEPTGIINLNETQRIPTGDGRQERQGGRHRGAVRAPRRLRERAQSLPGRATPSSRWASSSVVSVTEPSGASSGDGAVPSAVSGDSW